MNLKDDEINNLKEKNIVLTKKIKNFENKKFININNSIDNNNSESYFVSSNRVPSDLSKNINDKLNIKDMKKKYKFNPSFHSSITNNIINKKIINKKMNLSTFNYSQLDLSSHLNKKKSKRDNSNNENVSLFFNKIEDNLYNTNNNSRNNIFKNINISNSIKLDHKGKNRFNVTSNNFNMQKNNVLINLNTINLEKLKLQKKLAEYRKIIDKKINALKRGNYRLSSSYKNRKTTIKMKKGQKFEKLDSFKDCQNNKEKSCFIKRKNFEKVNISYINIKRDNSCNVERKKKK